MNANLPMLICGAALLTFVCADAPAQDTSRVPDVRPEVSEMDSSVHADVLQPVTEQPQLPRKQIKQPASYSRWAFQPVNQSPATRFGPAPATPGSTFFGGMNAPPTIDTSLNAGLQASTQNSLTGAKSDSELTAKTGGRSVKSTDQRVDPGNLSIDRASINRDYAAQAIRGSRPSITKAPPPPVQPPAPAAAEFSPGLQENKLGLANPFVLSHPFPKTTAASSRGSLDKSKPRKGRSPRRAKSTLKGKSLDSAVVTEKK